MRNKTAYWHAVGVLCVIVELLQQEENKPQQGNTFKLGEMVQDLFLQWPDSSTACRPYSIFEVKVL